MTPKDKQAAFLIFLNKIKLLRLAIALTFPLMSSCISHGLPEPVSGYVLSDSRLTKVFIPDTVALLKNEGSNQASKNRELGSQYLLGFIPLTSTYFEHGKQQLVDEVVIDLLAKDGFRVAEVQKKDLAKLKSSMPLQGIVEVKIDSLRANAWDLLLTRKLSVSAELVVNFYNQNSADTLRPSFSQKVEISEYSILPQAQGPRISTFIEKTLKNKLEPLLQQVRKRPKLRHQSVEESGKFLAVDMPRAEFDISEINGKIIADSYGFKTWPGYSQGQLLRMIQRGVHQGIPSDTKSASFAGSRGPYPNVDMKILKTNVNRLELNQRESKLSLELNWNLISSDRPTPLSGRCTSNSYLDENLDGGWVFALEKAAANISNTMFSHTSAPETVCEKRR
jgi:hypothetical protein